MGGASGDRDEATGDDMPPVDAAAASDAGALEESGSDGNRCDAGSTTLDATDSDADAGLVPDGSPCVDALEDQDSGPLMDHSETSGADSP